MINISNTVEFGSQLIPGSTDGTNPDYPIVGADAVAISATTGGMSDTFEPLSNKLSEIDTSIESIDTTVQTLTGKVNNNETAIGNINGKVNTLTEKVNNNENSIGTINNNISDINGRIDNITSSPGGEIVEIEQTTGENINSNTFNAVSAITKENNKIKVKTDTITIPESSNITVVAAETITSVPKFGDTVIFSADNTEVGTNIINNREVRITIPKLEKSAETGNPIDISNESAYFVTNILLKDRDVDSNAYLQETKCSINVDTLKNKVTYISENYFNDVHTVPPTEVKIGDQNMDPYNNKSKIIVTQHVQKDLSSKTALLKQPVELNFSPIIDVVRTSYNRANLLTEQMQTVRTEISKINTENQYLKNCIEQIRTVDINGNYEPYVPKTLTYTGLDQQLILPGKSNNEYDYYYSINSNPNLSNYTTYTTYAHELTGNAIGYYTVKYIAVLKQ